MAFQFFHLNSWSVEYFLSSQMGQSDGIFLSTVQPWKYLFGLQVPEAISCQALKTFSLCIWSILFGQRLKRNLMQVSRAISLLRFLLLVPCSASFGSFAVLNFDLIPLQLREATVIYLASTTSSVQKVPPGRKLEKLCGSPYIFLFFQGITVLHCLLSKILSIALYIYNILYRIYSVIHIYYPVYDIQFYPVPHTLLWLETDVFVTANL